MLVLVEQSLLHSILLLCVVASLSVGHAKGCRAEIGLLRCKLGSWEVVKKTTSRKNPVYPEIQTTQKTQRDACAHGD